MDLNRDNYFWQGKRVRLRPHMPEDWVMKHQELMDTEARRLLEYTTELPQTAEEYKAYFAGPNPVLQESGDLAFAIETLTGEFVGWIRMHSRSSQNGTFSGGMGIFAPYRKNGYAEEALRMILRYGFYELRYQKFNGGCVATNLGSIKLQKKIGFVEEGIRRSNLYFDGKFHDECLLGLTREEFEANDKVYLAE